MSLPVNIANLINGKTVESERLEFKQSWNLLDIMQTIAAFADDLNNWGGGYIIIGVSEERGAPILPPIGMTQSEIDKAQKELLRLCNEIRPPYFPLAEPVELMNKMILVIWVPASDTRPHKAPKSLSSPRDYRYFIRRYSSTVVANQKEETDLIQTSARTPFDDQIQQNASISDLSLPLVQTHLLTIGSTLYEQSSSIPFEELCRKMNIVAGPPEYIRPKNIGLLMFSQNPTVFFKGAQIDIVHFKDASGDSFIEKTFTGPIQQQLQDALSYLKNNIITEKVTKVPGKAEAKRAFNYPYEAIEEALVNTVYHRSYQDDSPIEVRVHPDRIELISFPGPLPPLNKDKLHSGKIVARKYRNRRIGDFLKELRLTEGRGTGIPKIQKVMQLNGSPSPVFDTDDELSYFLTTLYAHPSFVLSPGVHDGDVDGINIEKTILEFCLRPKKRAEIMFRIGVFHNTKNWNAYVKPLVDNGSLGQTVPDKPTSKYQQYRTTAQGEEILKSTQRG